MPQNYKFLEEALQSAESPVELLRNSQRDPIVYPVVPAQFTNWRDEQRAWRETCGLFDLSHHMVDLCLEGPDALQLLSKLSVNSFQGFEVNRAKQLVACSYSGHVIGDGILYHPRENRFCLVGQPMIHDWVQYNLESGKYDVSVERYENSARREGPPNVYRYQVQGPFAPEIMQKVTNGKLPDVRFFNVAEIEVAGHRVSALRHGMAGQPGYELSGPWIEGDDVRRAIVDAGEEHGLRQVGSLAYSMANIESGWIPNPCPAIYSDERLKAYREWLPVSSIGSIGGSFRSENIADYYLTPYDLGYRRVVKFDHDFVGRDALENMAGGPHRQKVTLVWNGKDASRPFQSLFENGLPMKYIELPKSRYAYHPYDQVLRDGAPVGVSMDPGYSFNERAMLSLAMVDSELSEPGTEVTLLWGEEPNSRKPRVEPHVQTEIRATVAPAPIAEFARTNYRTRT